MTALDLGGFPTVARADAQATRAASCLLASFPSVWQLDLPPLGGARVETVGVARVPEDVIALVIRRDGLSGRLCVPAALAARWVDRAISGRELFAPARVLGPAERGVLIAVLAPLLDPAGWSFALGTAVPLPEPGIVLRVEAAAGTGSIWLQAPALPGRPPHPARAPGLPMDVRVRVAVTTVAAEALADLASGDVVLFDGVMGGWLASGEAADVRLTAGAFQAEARLDADGRLTVARGWRSDNIGPEEKDVRMDADKTDPAVATLAAAPIEVVAELGRLTLRGDEVLGLAPGVVLGLRVTRTSAVSLRIGGELWAEGELVNVEGELGVRVTRLVPR
ncbi:MAG TPA: FliM/FliN family flagellar motor switch protein [Polyangia bacterium]|nr:FliM/FliN family flagellar motor switch protein [Polyangia bacterium]